MVLTVYCLLMSFVLQKLGWVMSERERAKVNEATLLKQVRLSPAGQPVPPLNVVCLFQESRRRMFQEKAGAILHVIISSSLERLIMPKPGTKWFLRHF